VPEAVGSGKPEVEAAAPGPGKSHEAMRLLRLGPLLRGRLLERVVWQQTTFRPRPNQRLWQANPKAGAPAVHSREVHRKVFVQCLGLKSLSPVTRSILKGNSGE